MEQFNTKKLVLGLNKSDVNAYNKLFLHFYEKVYNFCLKFFYREPDAEEIAQEVFIVVWNNRKEIDHKASFSSYIFGIAKNKIYNVYRRAAYNESFINYAVLSDPNFSYVTDETILFNELNNAYENLIQQLPERRREIFILSRKKGFKYKEIAEKLNISENTVDVQVRKALDFIRKGIRQFYG